MPDEFTISVTLTEEQALAYAQFLKRACFSDYASNSVDKDETYLMIDAGERLRTALARAGFAPR
mgnify:CR=1 FL=1